VKLSELRREVVEEGSANDEEEDEEEEDVWRIVCTNVFPLQDNTYLSSADVVLPAICDY
jgi:hypothetical protein